MVLLLSGIALAVTGLAVLLAQTVGWLPPGLAVSLLALAAVFMGTALLVGGAIRIGRRPPG
ncbi:MAG: hypothetical protein JJT90_09870 [Ectothiorhodospiraceae bacterium]|nr:hypothetical protein [Ectothiorhodospiraceae bacterium]